MSDLRITPTPTDAEAAAIAAALVIAAAPAPAAEVEQPVEPRWRFSGRWWNKPIPHSRLRPWRA